MQTKALLVQLLHILILGVFLLYVGIVQPRNPWFYYCLILLGIVAVVYFSIHAKESLLSKFSKTIKAREFPQQVSDIEESNIKSFTVDKGETYVKVEVKEGKFAWFKKEGTEYASSRWKFVEGLGKEPLPSTDKIITSIQDQLSDLI